MTQERVFAPDWLDAEGAAYILSLPVSTFHEYVAAGALPAGAKIGKHTRWSRVALNSSLAEKDAPSKSASLKKRFREAVHGQEKEGGRDAA